MAEEEEKRKCKYCFEVIVGGHDARLEHKNKCTARAKQKQQPEKLPEIRNKTPSPSPQPTFFVCKYCGKAFKSAEKHDEAKCLEGLPLWHRQRLQNAKKAAPLPNDGSSIALAAYDKSMDELVAKFVPLPSKPAQDMSWARCQYCNKKVVKYMLLHHELESCVVGATMAKVDRLQALVSSDKAPERGKKNLYAMLTAEDAALEEARKCASVIDAVVPVRDLFPPESWSGPLCLPQMGNLREMLDSIKGRVVNWMKKLKEENETPDVPLCKALHNPEIHRSYEEVEQAQVSKRAVRHAKELAATKTSVKMGFDEEKRCVFSPELLRQARGVLRGEVTFNEALEGGRRRVKRTHYVSALDPALRW